MGSRPHWVGTLPHMVTAWTVISFVSSGKGSEGLSLLKRCQLAFRWAGQRWIMCCNWSSMHCFNSSSTVDVLLMTVWFSKVSHVPLAAGKSVVVGGKMEGELY